MEMLIQYTVEQGSKLTVVRAGPQKNLTDQLNTNFSGPPDQ